jgi:hypothetical protein
MREGGMFRTWIGNRLSGPIPNLYEEFPGQTLELFRNVKDVKKAGGSLTTLIVSLRRRGRLSESKMLEDIEKLSLKEIERGIRDLERGISDLELVAVTV